MATIHKITVYIVDPNDYYNDWEDILDHTDCEDLYYTTASAEMRSFEWEDELTINWSECELKEFEKYFE